MPLLSEILNLMALLALEPVMLLWWCWRPLVKRVLFLLPDSPPNGFFGVVVPQGFQPDKPLFARRPNR